MKSYQLIVYIDSTFYPQDKQGYSCYYLEGFLKELTIKEEIISLGKTESSAFTEYLGIEKSLIEIEKLLKSKEISTNKVELKLYTDLQVLPRQYKKWILPPKEKNILNCYIRICNLLSKYHKADIFWIERDKNIAGKRLEKFVNSIKNSRNSDNIIKNQPFKNLIKNIKLNNNNVDDKSN